MADWTGQRMDSKDPFTAGDEYIAWLEERGRDPRQKRLIARDALDVDKILALHAYFGGTIVQGDAWDFRAAADFEDGSRWAAGAADPVQRRLGDVFDQRLQKLESAGGWEL